VTAFLLIPFDLCARDVLHDRWRGGGRLFRNMALLVAGGSLLSCLVSPGSQRVALASMIAFAAAGGADSVVYHLARGRSRFARMNLSNAAAGALDSVVFPLVAFGATTFALSGAQAGAKFAGGLAWSFVFVRALGRSDVRDQ
jgi:queuosine precursor transporter